MKRVRPYRTLIALALSLAAITAVTVAVVNDSARRAACSILTPAGGAVLAMSMAVLVIAGIALLRQVRRESDQADRMIGRRSCAGCGRDVHGTWRMCPYCGELVSDARAPRKGEVPA